MLADERLDPNSFYPPRDRKGQKQLHRFELPGMLRAAPGILGFFTAVVPEEFYAEGVEDGVPIIAVACRCGEEPILRFGQRAFSLAACACGRFFLYDGKSLRSGRGDS